MKRMHKIITISLCICLWASSHTMAAEPIVQISEGFIPNTGAGAGIVKNEQPTTDVAGQLNRQDGWKSVITRVEGYVDPSGRQEYSVQGESIKVETEEELRYEGYAKMEFEEPGRTEEYRYKLDGTTHTEVVSSVSGSSADETTSDDPQTILDPLPLEIDPTESTEDIVAGSNSPVEIGKEDSKIKETATEEPTTTPTTSPETTPEEQEETPKGAQNGYEVINKFTVETEEGLVEIVIVQYPSGIIEVLKTFKNSEVITYEAGMDLSEWEYDHEELQYAIWWGKNTTNSDWLRYYGNAYRYVNGTRSESLTPESTSINFVLGDEPYDDGKWSIMMEPVYKRWYKKTREIVHTEFNWEIKEEYTWSETKTDWLEVMDEHSHDPVFYEVTVPLICDGCPAITICLGDDADCDCGDLNTKCDDELEPDIVIDHRSELTN